MSRLLYKRYLRQEPLSYPDIRPHIHIYQIPLLAHGMQPLLVHLADRVQGAVMAFGGRYDEKIGKGAYGLSTSAIDKVAEDAVLDELDRLKEKLNVLSEEAGFIDRGGDMTLVLDPVDGTHNAERGLPIYSTSMAIGKDSMESTTFALVRDLVSGKTYHATKGKGAFMDGLRLHVRTFSEDDTLFTVYLGINAHENAYKVASRGRRVRSLGAASLDMCIVASGAADLYYMNTKAKHAELRVVDIAASALILREAGGEVVDLNRSKLDMPYHTKAISNLIAYGDPRVMELIP